MVLQKMYMNEEDEKVRAACALGGGRPEHCGVPGHRRAMVQGTVTSSA